MQNHYPLWKNILIIFIILLGVVYSLPNIFSEKPSIQISANRGNSLDIQQFDKIKVDIHAANVELNKANFKDGKVLLVFNDEKQQLSALKALEKTLGDNNTVALSYSPDTPSWLTAIWAQPMRLGLDLRGGVRFLMEVDTNSLISRNYQNLTGFLRDQANQQGLIVQSVVYQQKDNDIVATFNKDSDASQFTSKIRSTMPDLHAVSQGNLVILKYTDAKISEVETTAINQSLEILRNRVTEIGVAEPVIQRQGVNDIVVELPGIHDVTRAKEIIGATATLSFNMVNTSITPEQIAANLIPADTVIIYNKAGRPNAIYKHSIISGSEIIDASSGRGESGQPQVNIRLNSEGAKLISEATKAAIGRPMATIYSEYKDTGRKNAQGKPVLRKIQEVANVATIQARLGASFVITGIGSIQEANNLAVILRSGSLVAPIQIVSEQVIGPSLGAANIKQGLTASFWSLIAVMVFMTVVFRFFGFVATIVMIFNLILTIAALSILPGTTLTLPGIAGLVLTIGTSVDANVLIYSRIIDELRMGHSPQVALSEGYNGAWTSIFDANLTTILTAAILFMFGTGPIKGFAITLAVGIAISMFTAIVASKMIFNWVYGSRRNCRRLHI